MSVNPNRSKDEYLLLLILAYFKEHVEDYSFAELADELGCSIIKLSDYIEKLISAYLLEYHNNLLSITLEGLNYLCQEGMAYYTFDAKINDLYENEKLPEDEVYISHAFSKKRWRGSK